MENVIQIDSVKAYNDLFGFDTPHPLVSVVDLSEAEKWPTDYRMRFGLYAVYLKDTQCGDIRYGRQKYDYREGTIVAFAPGQVTGIEMNEGMRPSSLAVLFHPDLIKGTSLGREMGQYSFFSYETAEALHLSDMEKEIVTDCLSHIRAELRHGGDGLSKRLISKNIELMLDYCLRFYERQFHTRAAANNDVLAKFEHLLDDYFQNEQLRAQGLPTVRYFADKICLSPNYFGDLIKRETGKSAQENIQNKLMDVAKEWILGTDKTITQIAYELGFQYSQHFNRVFKRNVGYTPSEYRMAN